MSQTALKVKKYVFKILAGAQQFKSARYSFCTVGVW
jgi:hypothetical protein